MKSVDRRMKLGTDIVIFFVFYKHDDDPPSTCELNLSNYPFDFSNRTALQMYMYNLHGFWLHMFVWSSNSNKCPNTWSFPTHNVRRWWDKWGCKYFTHIRTGPPLALTFAMVAPSFAHGAPAHRWEEVRLVLSVLNCHKACHWRRINKP